MRRPRVTAALAVLATMLAGAATAQGQPRVEVGASMAGVSVGLGDDNDVTMLGIPSSGFGLIDPGLYAALFAGDHFALEPKVGLVWVSADGESNHILNLTGQATYFVSGTTRPSLYLLAAAGVLDMSGDDSSPKTVAGGVGYRIPVGDRLVFRLDGRYLHATDDGGNQVLFSLSIGGVFGR